MKVEPIVQSRWLNAISAMLNAPLRQAVEALPFVREVRLVARYARPMPMDEPLRTLPKVQAYQIDYGPSLTQHAIMHVPEVHEL
ncbi:MAG: hypothetical protein ONB16_04445, partial [candidate division KSB1 bacterium]|nr:hypothetical protein [candidate division KSB1 bacterium]